MPGERQERRRKTISEPEIVHREAMPVILTTPEEVQLRLMGDPAEALELKRPLPDSALRIVARVRGRTAVYRRCDKAHCAFASVVLVAC